MLNMKTKLKDFIIFFIYYTGLYDLVNQLLAKKGLYIVGYHRLCDETEDVHVLSVTRKNFLDHLKFYRKYFEIISINEVESILQQEKIDKNYMVITFDDGYRDNYTIGKRIFEENKIRPTIYLTVSPIEYRKTLWTDIVDSIIHSYTGNDIILDIHNIKGEFSLTSYIERQSLTELIKDTIKECDEETKYLIINQLINTFQVNPSIYNDTLNLHWEEVRELADSGVILGGHTMIHPTLSKISLSELIHEVAEPKKMIEERTQQEVVHFAYPYGKANHYNSVVKNELSRYYKTSVTAIEGVNQAGEDLFELKRVMVDNVGVNRLRFRLLKIKLLYALRKKKESI